MYHIVQNKRAQTSAECVGEGLFVCLKSQSFGETSVSDICRAAGVSRATFYRLFDTPTDVLCWCCDRTAQGLDAYLSQRLSEGKPIVFRDVMQYMFEHSRAIETAVRCHRTDLVHDALYTNMHVLQDVLLQAHESQTFTETNMEYITNMLLGMMTSLLSVWISRGRTETFAQLEEYVRLTGTIYNPILGR